jgi:3-phosphoshikimate 1-carboxyvinyltransferase
LNDVESEIALKGDAEFAAFLAASALSHMRGKLILRNYSNEDFTATPLGQLRRMGAEIVALDKSGEGGHLVTMSSLKARKVPYEQLHDYPDAIGALALAACASDGTSVIRSLPFNTKREEERRRRICEVIRTLGVKVAEIEDGVVLEGKRELSGDAIHSENDPICALMAVAATLGTVDQVEIDDISPAISRWGSSFEKLLKVLPISP